MGNPTTTAFTTIQAANGLTESRPPLKDDKELLNVVKVEILPCLNPYVKWYRHPIWWWKWRHFRHDVKVLEEAVDPEFKQKFDEELERQIMFGTGAKEENN